MRRLLLIANPSSSAFTGALHRDVVSELTRAFAVVPIWPVSPAGARQQAVDAAAEGFEVVVAMGGDGVVHHVANGLVHTQTALGIVPAGTTNVLARIHGIPRDPRKAAAALAAALPQPTDVLRVSSDSLAGARSEFVLFSVGMGFDADVVAVAEQFPHSKLWFGSIHYARAAVGRVLGPYRGRAPDLTIDAGGERVRGVAVFAQVHDLYTYFGRLPMRLTHGADRGRAAAVLHRLNPLIAARLAIRLALQRDISRDSAVHRWTGFDSLVARADEPAPFQADGEHLGHARSVEIKPDPDALLVLRS